MPSFWYPSLSLGLSRHSLRIRFTEFLVKEDILYYPCIGKLWGLSPAYVGRKVDLIEAAQNIIVHLHGVWGGEWRPGKQCHHTWGYRDHFWSYVPVSSSYMSIPSDQKSTALSWPFEVVVMRNLSLPIIWLPCSGWSLAPHTRECRRMSRSSAPSPVAWRTRSPPSSRSRQSLNTDNSTYFHYFRQCSRSGNLAGGSLAWCPGRWSPACGGSPGRSPRSQGRTETSSRQNFLPANIILMFIQGCQQLLMYFICVWGALKGPKFNFKPVHFALYFGNFTLLALKLILASKLSELEQFENQAANNQIARKRVEIRPKSNQCYCQASGQMFFGWVMLTW